MSITPTQFKTRFTVFSSISDDKIQIFIDEAEIVLNEVYWGSKYDLGLYYYAAHALAVNNYSEAGNTVSKSPVSGKSVDGSSTSYSTATLNNQSDNYYASTIYGQKYLTLRNSLGVPASVI